MAHPVTIVRASRSPKAIIEMPHIRLIMVMLFGVIDVLKRFTTVDSEMNHVEDAIASPAANKVTSAAERADW